MPEGIKPSSLQVIKEKLKGEEPRCEYPGCKHIGEAVCSIEVTNEKNARVELPFCWYHNYIVMGGHFTAVKINRSDNKDEPHYDFQIEGPFREVEIAEQVFASIEMIRHEKKKKTLE